MDNLLTRYELIARGEVASPKTIDHVKLAVRLFTSFLGGIQDVRKVTADDLRHFVIALEQRPKWAGTLHEKKEKISRTTLNTYVRGVKAFWAWLKREGIIEDNPLLVVRSPKLPALLPKVMTKEQMVAVFKTVANRPREMAVLLVLLDCGISLSELEGLNDADVDVANGAIKVFRKKTLKERYVYVSPLTTAAIERYRFFRPQPVAENTLFLTHDGYPLTGRRIQKILERVGREAGISERLSPHKLRHTFATWSLKYGSNLEYIRIILGHSDIRTTSKFYLHATSDDVATAHKNFSPVVNLGITGSKEQAVKVRKRGNILIEYATGAGDGNMPVVYSKEKKVRGNNRRK